MEKSDRLTHGEVHQSHSEQRHSFFIGWGVPRTYNLQQQAHLRKREEREEEKDRWRQRKRVRNKHEVESPQEKARAWGRTRAGDTGGWDSLNDSVLPFTFHTRTLLALPRGGGREEVWSRCVWCGLVCSREKDGEIYSEDVIITRLPCFGLTRGQQKRCRKHAETHRTHINISTYIHQHMHTNRHAGNSFFFLSPFDSFESIYINSKYYTASSK